MRLVALLALLISPVLLAQAPGPAGPMPGNAPAVREFILFDGTKYQRKPDLRRAGVQPLHIAYEPNLFSERIRSARPADAMPTDRLLAFEASEARRAGGEYMVVDIEAWSVNRSRQYPAQVAANIARYVAVMRQARRVAPDLRIGLFGPLPVHSGYERLIAPTNSRLHAEMVEDNDNLVGLASMVDAIFPIGYAMTDDREEWRRALGKQVSEARRLNPSVPVYVFLWPQYADYGPARDGMKLRWIETDFWRYQLDTVREIADGAVLWGGWNPACHCPDNWDPSAAWWRETRDFLRAERLSAGLER